MKNLRAIPSRKPVNHYKRLKKISSGAAYLYKAVILPKTQGKEVNTGCAAAQFTFRLYRNTGGDKNRYLECIQSAADEIKALRVQLETAKSKLEKCDEANAEINRLCDWLDCHDTSFADYDDIVIRRVVECIKVYKDGTIKVITKFGTEATETI